MRKSSFGQRPPRGKGEHGGRSSGKDARQERRDRGEARGAPDGGKGGFFRSRKTAGKGPREERPDARGPLKKGRRDFGETREAQGDRAERRDAHRARAPGKAGLFRERSRGGPHGKKPAQPTAASVSEPMRIAKAMARAGLCSRREAERWIADGRVSINGQVLKTPAVEVKPRDRVLVDGQPLPVAEPAQIWRYYKPKGLVTTHNDPQGRPTVFDNLPPGLPRVISVGRLDFNTEGLILLTNDGELARHLELPATGWLRRYRVRAKGRATQADFDKLKDGVEIEGVRYGPVEALIDTVQGANMWVTIGIREGKNREVRKVLSSLGLEVNRLIRISFGPFQLLELEPGEAEPIKRRVLADQLGPKLAAEFGLVDRNDGNGAKPSAGQRPQQKKSARRGESG
jgi:23S rRNA pseudouridine2605 synthase